MGNDKEFEKFHKDIERMVNLVNTRRVSEAKSEIIEWSGKFIKRADLFNRNMLLMFRVACIGYIVGQPEIPRSLAHIYRTESRDLNDVQEFLVPRGPGTMVDVGAQWGTVCTPFLWQGWRVLALEPDPDSLARIRDAFSGLFQLTVDSRAVSDVEEKNVRFYTGGTTNVRSLHGMHEPSGKEQADSYEVDVTTLESAFERHKIKSVTYLKIDVEGYEIKVLKGIPWEKVRPQVIVAEFDNGLCSDLECSAEDISSFLSAKDYHTVISEWEPIIQYGEGHKWKRYTRDAGSVDSSAWGNVIAFDNERDYRAFADEFMSS